MSIDARVCGVQYTFAAGGPGRLFLEDRPSESGPDGCKGQSILHFDDAPEWVPLLIDKDVWGNSEVLMFGGQEIARRIGYSRIRFTAERLRGLGPTHAAHEV